MFFSEVGTAFKFTEVGPYDERFPWNHWDNILMDFPKWLLSGESSQIIDKFCSGPWADFLNMAYILMQVIRNVKQSFADVFQNNCS